MKKFLSAILIATMIFSLLPMVSAKEENRNVDESNFFVFSNESHGLTEYTKFSKMQHTLEKHVEGVGDPWAFVNMRLGSTFGTDETGFIWKIKVDDAFPLYNPGGSTAGYSTSAVAFELVFDTAGTFNPAITYISAKSSPKVDFYLVDKTKEKDQWYATPNEDGSAYQLNDSYFYSGRVKNLKAGDFLGTVDMYGDGAVDTAILPAREVKAQSYYLVAIPNGNNEKMEKLEESGNKFCTLNIKSFAMAERPEFDKIDALEYLIQFNTVMNKGLLPFKSDSGTSFTLDDGTVINCMRGSNMLHHIPFASWKATYNYRAELDESGAKIAKTAVSCEPYNTMLLANTDPWMIEGGTIPYCHSSSVSAYHAIGTFKTATYDDDARARITVRINVPHAGKYKIQLRHNYQSGEANGAHTEVFFGKAPVKTISGELHNTYLSTYQNLGWFKCTDKEMSKYTDFGEVDVPVGGEYIVSFYPSPESLLEENGNPVKNDTGNYAKNPYQQMSVAGIKLIPVEDTELSEIQTEADAIAKENESLVTYESEAGVAKTKTTVNAFAAYIDGTEIESDIINISAATVGEKCTVKAPEQSGYTFLYWAKGASDKKMIMSRNEEYTFVPHSDAINLIAVYEKDGNSASNKAEFYNANGVIIKTLLADGVAPALPAMAGFGKATHWALYGSDEAFAPGDEIAVSGTMMFVANYEDKQKLDITVIGGEISNSKPEYGEEITVTASDREIGGTKVFNCWMRDGKAVSFDKEYTFKAWENATLTAVYKEFKPSLAKTFRKIILDSFAIDGETDAVMAEFIGLDDAIEKGIMFGGTKRSAMTSDDTQYSIINDTEEEAVGYAILPDGTIITDK